MEVLTIITRLGLIAIVAAAAIAAVAYGLTRLAEAADVIDDAEDIYDWDAEDDFPTAPVLVPPYLRENHNLMPRITDDGAEARCSCGRWATFVPSFSVGQQRAYDFACDLYWSGHIASLGATA